MFLLFKLIKPLVLLVVLVGVYLFAPAIGGVSGKALHKNVVRASGGSDIVGAHACRKRGTVTWRCSVYGPSASDPSTYAVRMEGRRCWTARKTAGQPLARRANGCVDLRDQLYALAGIG